MTKQLLKELDSQAQDPALNQGGFIQGLQAKVEAEDKIINEDDDLLVKAHSAQIWAGREQREEGRSRAFKRRNINGHKLGTPGGAFRVRTWGFSCC